MLVRKGKLTADGEQGNRIVLTGHEHTKGYWNGVAFNRSNSTDNVVDYVTIEDGGGKQYSAGTLKDSEKANLQLNGHGQDVDVRIKVTNSTFRNSDGYGLSVYPNVTFDACNNNEFENNRSGKSDEDSTCP